MREADTGVDHDQLTAAERSTYVVRSQPQVAQLRARHHADLPEEEVVQVFTHLIVGGEHRRTARARPARTLAP